MRRRLRILLAEFLIETGTIIRDVGIFALPKRHPRSEQELNGNRASVKSKLADRASAYRSPPSE